MKFWIVPEPCTNWKQQLEQVKAKKSKCGEFITLENGEIQHRHFAKTKKEALAKFRKRVLAKNESLADRITLNNRFLIESYGEEY